jgi:hypothetical protein
MRNIYKKEGRLSPTPEFLLAQYVLGGTPPILPQLFRGPSIMARAADAQGILHIFAAII